VSWVLLEAELEEVAVAGLVELLEAVVELLEAVVELLGVEAELADALAAPWLLLRMAG
jgi:hypothetical protein